MSAAQLALSLPWPRGDIDEVAVGAITEVRADGKVAARVRPAAGGWECVHVGAVCSRTYGSHSEALAVARRIARMLVAGTRESWRRLTP